MTRASRDIRESEHWDAIDTARDIESDATWDHVFALRKAGTLSVLERASAWCRDADPFRRSIGVSILAQLGDDGKSFPDESCSILRSMLPIEHDHEVITSLISAVSFRQMSDGTPWLIALAQHASEDIRWRVAWALPIPDANHPQPGPDVLGTLMRLLQDPEPQVRDWATFSLSATDEDTPEIRDALLERMADADFGARSEAAIGLAKRKEPRGIPRLIDALHSDRVGELYVEAAEMYGDPRLKPALVALKRWWDIHPELLDRAIAACSWKPLGPSF